MYKCLCVDKCLCSSASESTFNSVIIPYTTRHANTNISKLEWRVVILRKSFIFYQSLCAEMNQRI